MSEMLKYHTVEELRALSLDELRALWELVPTDRQRSYRAAYDREVKTAGAEGSDVKERRIALALLKRYHESALVPIGMRWARTPQRVQDAAAAGAGLDDGDTSPKAAGGKPSARMLLVLGALLRGSGGSDTAEVTPEMRLSITRTAGMTATPLALEAQDDVIAGGDAGNAAFYPLNLQIRLPGEVAPRV